MKIIGIENRGDSYAVYLENGETLEGITAGNITMDGTRDYIRLELDIVVPSSDMVHMRGVSLPNIVRHENGYFTRDVAQAPTALTEEHFREAAALVTRDEYQRAYEGSPEGPVDINHITIHRRDQEPRETPALWLGEQHLDRPVRTVTEMELLREQYAPQQIDINRMNEYFEGTLTNAVIPEPVTAQLETAAEAFARDENRGNPVDQVYIDGVLV